MKHIAALISSVLLASSVASAFEGKGSFMPPNNLHLQDKMNGGEGITEEQFNAVMDRAEAIYKPIIAKMGATLSMERRWSDNTVNAYADQPTPTKWVVHMFGGLARRSEVTEDGFAMVVCHELGHHIGGYPYVESWAANEGQSDMYATGACASKLFADNLELSFAAQDSLPAEMIEKCDRNHPPEGRDVCYRAIAAGKSLGDLLGALKNQKVNFNTPDTRVVTRTNNKHPDAQCRLDTYVASALCGSSTWDYDLIPGKSFANRNSFQAQTEAFAHSCTTGEGARPRCWFAALTADSPAPEPAPSCPLGNDALCEAVCKINPEMPWCAESDHDHDHDHY